jgi:hypothetical protein
VLGGLLIFSPMLVEMSGWIMFESICGCLALAAWWAYFGETRRQRRAACLLVTLIFLTKYHYGLFLGATFLAALLSEETARGRSALRAAVRDLAASRLAQTAAVLAAVLFIVRRILAHRSEGAPTWMPESNIFYGLLLLAALAAFWKRERLAALARELSPRLRDILNYTILPSAAWLLLPGKVRGWYGQTFFDPPPEIARGFFENLQTFGRALAEDYTRSPWLALFLIGGVLLALGPPRGVDSRLRWLALFAIWPPLVIAASPLPAEARFLGFVAPALITAGTLGFLSWSSRLPAPLAAPAAIALAAAVLAAQVLPVLREGGGVYAARASYRYPNTPGEDAFIRRLLAAAPPDAPALVVTDDRHRLEPTIRLALRLRSPGISPRHVIVRRETVEEALARAAELPAPWVLVAPAGEADPEAIARAAGREALSLGRLGQIEEGEPEYVMLSLRARAP